MNSTCTVIIVHKAAKISERQYWRTGERETWRLEELNFADKSASQNGVIRTELVLGHG